MHRHVIDFLTSDEGATAVEYAVVLSLIAGVCIGSVLVLSNAAASSFDDSANRLAAAFGS